MFFFVRCLLDLSGSSWFVYLYLICIQLQFWLGKRVQKLQPILCKPDVECKRLKNINHYDHRLFKMKFFVNCSLFQSAHVSIIYSIPFADPQSYARTHIILYVIMWKRLVGNNLHESSVHFCVCMAPQILLWPIEYLWRLNIRSETSLKSDKLHFISYICLAKTPFKIREAYLAFRVADVNQIIDHQLETINNPCLGFNWTSN